VMMTMRRQKLCGEALEYGRLGGRRSIVPEQIAYGRTAPHRCFILKDFEEILALLSINDGARCCCHTGSDVFTINIISAIIS